MQRADGKPKARGLAAVEQRRRILKLSIAGHSQEEIAQVIGIGRRAVNEHLHRALQEYVEPELEMWRGKVVARFETLHAQAFKEVLNAKDSQTKLGAIEVCARIPVHIIYSTAWAEGKDTIYFGPDIYGRDKKLSQILFGES